MTTGPLLEARRVSKRFPLPGGSGEFTVLEKVDLALDEGQVVALLGKSGSGKSTLLRILAGLIPASEGEVHYRGRPVTGPCAGVAMVFQSFALLPWLDVLGNVELGLKARGMPSEARRAKALRMIDMIGLDGFESAYPRELSGGMRQRVGIARALAVEPDILLMDEPFSALDVLTAESLRGELMDLWIGRKIPTRAILIVTHNIEEAALLADRVVVLGNDPGHVRSDLRIDLARPRTREDSDVQAFSDELYQLLTRPEAAREAAQPDARVAQPPLPHARVGALAGFSRKPASVEAAWTCTAWPPSSSWTSPICCRWWTPRSCWAGSRCARVTRSSPATAMPSSRRPCSPARSSSARRWSDARRW